ncbi:E3 ubiquitin-protein ligase TRIM71-like [Pecten maximus]|uniref:E3 ubiquitin-protein ligase TRIM71-like n=1 Tax=Pecten maximus TaxID=6579 RepID=UPI0014584437|nr:E3 ubiquitin-protein ligase TRIM71-like [Pecten maximus]
MSKMNDPLQCGLCLKRHRDPRILTCFHSFCRECIEKLISTKKYKVSFPCPLCQTEIGIPKAGTKAYPENFYIRAIQATAAFSTISMCDTCDKTKEESASSRCLECECNYCGTCTARHLESDTTKEHHIIELCKPQSKTITNLTHKSFCEKHKNEETKFYCMLCEIPVCKECVSKVSDHKGHRYKSIAEGAKEKKDTISPIIKSMHEYLPILEEYLEEIKSSKKMLGDYASDSIKEIKARCQMLHDEIEKISKSLEEQVQKSEEKENQRLDKHIQMIERLLKSLSYTTGSTEDIANLASDSEFVMICAKLQNRFKRINQEVPSSGLISCESSNFHSGDMQGKNLFEMIGYCDESDVKMPLLPIPWGLRMALTFEVTLMYSFKVSDAMDTIHAIAPVSEKEAWICCGWGTNKMELWTREGEKKNTATLPIQVDDICVKPNGEILVSSYDGKKVVKLDSDLKPTDFVQLNWYPGGMTFTKKKELLVCAVDSYVTTRSNSSRRMVIRIKEDGTVLDQIEDNGFNEVFCAPYRLYENMIGDICVTDREETNVRVTSLTMEGVIKQTYTGPKEMVTKKPFNPFGVVSDKYGHVIVSDWSNHAVHILDISGQFIGFLLTEKNGIRGPNALALDKEGHLWVGDTKSTVWVFQYRRKADDHSSSNSSA